MTPLQIQTPDVTELSKADSTARANIVETIDELSHMPFDDAVRTVTNALVHLGMKIIGALVIYFIGRWLIKKIKKMLENIFEHRHLDLSLRTFLLSLVQIIMYIFLIMTIIGILGLETTSFIAIFASAGIALGMALSGTLQNFAGGVMVLLLKPYRVGDYIEAQDQAGTVKSIQLFNTVINTPDNKTILIPNGSISTGVVNNYSKESTRRLEWIFTIAYGDDFGKAKSLIENILEGDSRVLSNPGWNVALNELGDSGIKIVVQVWVKAEDYWGVFYDINRMVYERFPENGISFPYQQIDINILNKPDTADNNTAVKDNNSQE